MIKVNRNIFNEAKEEKYIFLTLTVGWKNIKQNLAIQTRFNLILVVRIKSAVIERRITN